MGSATLAERVLSGDEVAIGELIDSCWPAMRYALLGGLADAAELRQAARVELFEAARAYDAAGDGDFAEHASRRVRRLVERLRRREQRLRARHVPIEELPEEQEPAAPEPSTPAPPNRRLNRAMGRLPARLRAVVVRLYYRELSALEVAAEVGLRPEDVERARRRALARLRRDLRGPRTMPRC